MCLNVRISELGLAKSVTYTKFSTITETSEKFFHVAPSIAYFAKLLFRDDYKSCQQIDSPVAINVGRS